MDVVRRVAIPLSVLLIASISVASSVAADGPTSEQDEAMDVMDPGPPDVSAPNDAQSSPTLPLLGFPPRTFTTPVDPYGTAAD